MTISTPHKNIASVGNHFTNTDEVKSFHIYDSPHCLYIPFGIEKFFANIEVLTVQFCGLKIVTKEDLKPLRHLRGLYLQNNEIEILGNDLFKHNPEIQEINLCDNKLKNVAVGVFEPLKNLQKVEILRNLCIDLSAIKSNEVEILIRNVKEKCPPKVFKNRNDCDLRLILLFFFVQILTHLPEIDSTGINEQTGIHVKIDAMERKFETFELKFKNSMGRICDMCKDEL